MWSMMIMMAAQIFTAPLGQPQTRLILMQAAEGAHPVPLCAPGGGHCQCPQGYVLEQRQDAASIGGQVMTCLPQEGPGAPRASDTDYPHIPRPETYGK